MDLLADFHEISTPFEAWYTLIILILLGMAIMLLIGAFVDMYDYKSTSYKRGQIDCLNGKVKYKKETNNDGETLWVECE